MAVSILPLPGTSLPNQGLHTVKLEPGEALDDFDCSRVLAKINQVCSKHHLQPWLPRTSACKYSTTPRPPCSWKKISQVCTLFYLLVFSFLILFLLSVRVNCWSLDRVGHCQACQFPKEWDPLLVQAISRLMIKNRLVHPKTNNISPQDLAGSPKGSFYMWKTEGGGGNGGGQHYYQPQHGSDPASPVHPHGPSQHSYAQQVGGGGGSNSLIRLGTFFSSP